MTLKDMMLGSAIAALVAGGAVAQTANTATEVTAANTETSAEAETTPSVQNDSAPVMDGEGAVEAEMDTQGSDGAVVTPETEETMTSTVEVSPEMDNSAMPSSISAMTVSEIVGMNVVGIDDETVGEIDYVVNQTDGLAFVIGIGGFLGLGEYTVAIPADQFTLNADGELALNSMTKSDLEAMPEFDEDGVEGLDGDLVIGDLTAS